MPFVPLPADKTVRRSKTKKAKGAPPLSFSIICFCLFSQANSPQISPGSVWIPEIGFPKAEISFKSPSASHRKRKTNPHFLFLPFLSRCLFLSAAAIVFLFRFRCASLPYKDRSQFLRYVLSSQHSYHKILFFRGIIVKGNIFIRPNIHGKSY